MNVPKLETERLVLLPANRLLAERYFQTNLDTEMYKFINDEPKSLVDLENHFAGMETGISPFNPKLTWLNWVVEIKGTQSPLIGFIEVGHFDGEQPTLGYWFGSNYCGKGYAFEACVKIINYLRSLEKFKFITSEIDTRNTSSIKLAEKLGFNLVETIQDADYFKGETSDEHVYKLDL